MEIPLKIVTSERNPYVEKVSMGSQEPLKISLVVVRPHCLGDLKQLVNALQEEVLIQLIDRLALERVSHKWKGVCRKYVFWQI